DQDGARAALAEVAALLRAGEHEVLPHEIEERRSRIDVQRMLLAVDAQRDLHAVARTPAFAELTRRLGSPRRRAPESAARPLRGYPGGTSVTKAAHRMCLARLHRGLHMHDGRSRERVVLSEGAEALARAFLAGDWTAAGLVARGSAVVERRPRVLHR